ncbi:hypothetical protein CkaCkLH20_09006 [Colletotrichum karsti]|uniref:Ribosomal RNA-processing protein 14/surfeit locus protein 6 C-terminal domain-containing protein n=1 Tax=Colletotrichum karsti TaxID=1095194 RepID=A0A9P6I0I2_9PEZI|nr:uncharacterized protein CkaCkLH20_09006 [Colletotrichum karsti]KAF9873547.1 hypothetical protein CkaCkLH20_09006 [Colletotrichum karsti]
MYAYAKSSLSQDQWQKKKQTKAEAKAAKTAKLDPDSELNRNAKEVMDERARNKRKLQDMQEEEDKADGGDDDDAVPGVQRELPGQGLRNKDNKKQRTADPIDTIDDANPAEMSQTQLMRLAKKEAKTNKRQEKKAKKAEKKAAKMEAAAAAGDDDESEQEQEEEQEQQPPKAAAKAPAAKKQAEPKKKQQKKKAESKDAEPAANDHDRDEEYETVNEEEEEQDQPTKSKDLRPLDVSGMDEDVADSASGDSTPQSPTFDTAAPNNTTAAAANEAAASTTTSTSSSVPPSEKPRHIQVPADTSALRARLAARIEALRAARKADGPDGKPIRTRSELIEARRAKEAQRKAHKKELRRQTRIEEDAKREEALASNSPSVMSPRVGINDDDNADAPANYAFGRVAFEDGTKLSHDLSHALSSHRKKGPSDPKTALAKLQNQKKRLAALDKEKQADVAEKEQWLTARRRAEGERIRDDEGALKKAVKRKEHAKKKSEKAWKERSDGVAKAIWEKQKKRDENIQKRKDDKLAHKLGRKSGKKKVGGGGGGAKKTKARPGFEGSFGGGKKKK